MAPSEPSRAAWHLAALTKAVAALLALLLAAPALGRLVCSGRVPLAEAQHAIAADWIAAYNHFIVGEQFF